MQPVGNCEPIDGQPLSRSKLSQSFPDRCRKLNKIKAIAKIQRSLLMTLFWLVVKAWLDLTPLGWPRTNARCIGFNDAARQTAGN